jgi:3-phenylpropionate/trans-cinnamate dioxygenase ferredoxin component
MKDDLMSDFVKVAELSDVDDGELMAVEVDGEPVCLANVGGSVYAFTDNCTHISGPLNEGELDGEVLTCPWHGAQFNVCTGKVLRGPARQDIQTYAVRVEGNSILVSLPDDI